MFQAIVNFSLRQRVFVLAITAILVGWGTLVARDMPIELLPETRPPSVIINTEAGSLAAEEVEQLVTMPIESVMNGMPGVTGVRSSSNPAVSLVQVVFEFGTDPYRSRQLVNEKLALVRERLPDGVVPMLAPMSNATGAIMVMGVTGGETPMKLREYVDWVLRPKLLSVEGVSEVLTVGGEVRTFRFTPNPSMMEYLGITLADVERTLQAFGGNTSGGFSEVHGTEFTIRNIGRTSSLDDMRSLVVSYREGVPVLLGQVGDVVFAPKVKRGDGTFNGKPAVDIQIIRQPVANTVAVAEKIQAALDEAQKSAPADIKLGLISYNQADMIKEAINNVAHLLRDAVLIVAVVLILFLASLRPTVISLVSIPISLVVTVLVFHLLDLSINNMTLGGIAIGLGQLVDDSVVNVENILRRLGENRKLPRPEPPMKVIGRASGEVRSGIVYATVIVLIVFIPLLAMPGRQGRMFTPMTIAYIVSILASLIVSITVTPAMASYLFPRMKSLDDDHGGSFARWLKRRNEKALIWVLDRPRSTMTVAILAVAASMATVPFMPRSFLPAFNEGNVYVGLLLDPSLSITESFRIGHMAEQILMTIPEVKAISRRSGRFDLDVDVDPVNDNEMPLVIKLDQGRSLRELQADIRNRMSIFAGDLDVNQFLMQRMESQDNMVRGEIVLKLYGPDLPTLRTLASGFHDQMAHVKGMTDVVVEQQTYAPQARIAVDYGRAKLFGITPAQITDMLAGFSNGRTVSQVIENGRRFDVTLRLADEDRTPDALAKLRIDTPAGLIPLSSFANLTSTYGPSRILREAGVRRIAVMANLDGTEDTAKVVQQTRDIIAKTALPTGYSAELEGEFKLGEQGRRVLSVLGPVAIALIFVVLQQRFRSTVLSLIIMGNIPLALVGSVIAIWIAGLDLNLAAIIGFIAVTGVAVRNSLLKVSHFINLHLHEDMPAGRELVVRGSTERLMPVLMTALAAGAALVPLLWSSDVAGAEILHPVAVTIFGGLISSTLLDTFTTPMLFEQFGVQALDKMIATHARLAHETF
jgi:HME family heavy-metal exporter